MIQFLLDSRDCAVLLLDEVLESIFLITQTRELLLQLGAIPIELQELFALLYGSIVRISENGSQATQ